MDWRKFKSQKLKELKEHVESGKADARIMALVDKINEAPDLVTTSSCTGRIVLLEFDLDERKKTSEFYKKWHRIVRAEEVELAVADHNQEVDLWFKVQPFILHVAAKDIKAAQRFLKLMRTVGVKRGGIQTIAKGKVMLEVQGNDNMAIPVAPIEARWNELVSLANKMFKKNIEVLDKLEELAWKR
jgi:tRNA wybutosine-synthesizing protein 3